MMKKFTAILLIIIIVVLGFGAVVVMRWMREMPAELITAADFSAAVSDSAGVDVNSTFVVDFPDKVGSASVRRALRVEPEITLGVHQGASRSQVQLVPAEPLEEDTVYTFTLSSGDTEYSWSFETKSPAKVVQTSPEDRTTGCDVTSCSVTFDQLLSVDLERAADYVSISPAVDGKLSQTGRTLTFTPLKGFAPGTIYRMTIRSGLPFIDTTMTLEHDVTFAFETQLSMIDRQLAATPVPCFVSGTQPEFTVRPAFVGDTEENITARVQLYSFATAGDYADALAAMQQSNPQWSISAGYQHGCNVNDATLLSTMNIRLTAMEDGYLLRWPNAVTNGYYLLRVIYRECIRDLLFAVSDLSVYVLPMANNTLFWVHDIKTGEASAGWVYERNNSADAVIDRDGTANLACTGTENVCLIETIDGKNLVLPVPTAVVSDDTAGRNWRYLYLDQANYQYGDTLYFWGVVEPRDGSDLPYKRVSVFIFADDGRQVYFDYADLTDQLFNGEIHLPRLLAGRYTLEIWQSGNQLISQSFTIDCTPDVSDTAVIARSGTKLLLDREDGYEPGDNFAASFHQKEGKYLFVELENGISRLSVGDNELYLGRFIPINQLNFYQQAICYSEGKYSASAPTLLHRNYSEFRLDVEITVPETYTPQAETQFSLTVRNIDGQPVKQAGVLVSVVCGASRPQFDPLKAIYEDYQGSGVNIPSGSRGVGSSYNGRTLYCAVYTADDKGQVNATVQLPAVSDDCYIVAQAISVDESIVLAGSSEQLLTPKKTVTDETDEGDLYYKFEAVEEAAGHLLNGNGGQQLIVVTSGQRIRLLRLLLEDACSKGTDALSALSSAVARTGLAAYGGTEMADLFTDDDCTSYQSEDGMVVDLPTSVLTAISGTESVSRIALQVFFDKILATSSNRAEQIQALCGLAACGGQSLAELKMLAEFDDLTASEQLWLALGLYYSGDEMSAWKLAMPLSAEMLSRDEAVLLTLLSALRLADESLLTTLSDDEGGKYDGLVQAIIVPLLLKQEAGGRNNFTYTLDSLSCDGKLNAEDNFFLLLEDFTGTLKFHSSMNGLGYCRISAMRTADSN